MELLAFVAFYLLLALARLWLYDRAVRHWPWTHARNLADKRQDVHQGDAPWAENLCPAHPGPGAQETLREEDGR